jgi:hypothetical protein
MLLNMCLQKGRRKAERLISQQQRTNIFYITLNIQNKNDGSLRNFYARKNN